MMMRHYLIKGHGGWADGHSISSSLRVGSFAPVGLIVNMVIIMRREEEEDKEEEVEKEEEDGDLLIAGGWNMSTIVYPTIAVLKHSRLKYNYQIWYFMNIS